MNDDDQIIGQEVPEVEEQSLPEDETQMPGVEAMADESSDLPEGVAERTRREFEKLKENNRKLKEELERTRLQDLATVTSSYEQPKPPVYNNFVDQEGYVDVNSLNAALREAQERAARAEAIALETKKERERRMVEEAHAKHPYLDPSNEGFDRQFYDLVRDRLIRNFSEGQERSVTQVADEIARVYKPANVDEAKKKAVEDYKKSETTKANINQSVNKRVEPDNYDELRRRTILGDKEALRERIKNL